MSPLQGVWNLECFAWTSVTVVKRLERGIFYLEECYRCMDCFTWRNVIVARRLERGLFYLEECTVTKRLEY